MNDNNGNTYKLLLMFVNIIQGNVQRDTIQKMCTFFIPCKTRIFKFIFFALF